MRSDFYCSKSGDFAQRTESWASGVQVELTRMVYPNYTRNYFGNYSGVVEDLIDDNPYFAGSLSYGDLTNGYSISQLESSLKGNKSLTDWKEKIRNDYSNNTEQSLDSTFNYWFNNN